jgi:hypothetical protein
MSGALSYGQIGSMTRVDRWLSIASSEWGASGMYPYSATALGSRLFVCGQFLQPPSGGVITGTITHAAFDSWPPTELRTTWTRIAGIEYCSSFARIPGRSDRIRVWNSEGWVDVDANGAVVARQDNGFAMLGFNEKVGPVRSSSAGVAILGSGGSVFRALGSGSFEAIYGGSGDREALYAAAEREGRVWMFGGPYHAIVVDPGSSTVSAARELPLPSLPGDVSGAIALDDGILLSGPTTTTGAWLGELVPTSTRVERIVALDPAIGPLAGFAALSKTRILAVSMRGILVSVDAATLEVRSVPPPRELGVVSACRAPDVWGAWRSDSMGPWRAIDGALGVVWVAGCDQHVLRVTETSTTVLALLSPVPMTPTLLTARSLCPDHVVIAAVHETGSLPPVLLDLRATRAGLENTRPSPTLAGYPRAMAGDDSGAVVVFDDSIEGLADLASILLPIGTGSSGNTDAAIRTRRGAIVASGASGRIALIR